MLGLNEESAFHFSPGFREPFLKRMKLMAPDGMITKGRAPDA